MDRTWGRASVTILLAAIGCARPPAREEPVRQETITLPQASGPRAPSRGLVPGERGAEPAYGGASDYFGLTVGAKLFFHVERSKLPHKFEPDGALGYEAGLFISDEEMGAGRLSLTFVPLEEDGQNRAVKAFWLDLTGGPEYRLWDAPVSGKLRCEFGFSLLYLDFQKNTYSTYAVGGVTRGVFGMYTRNSALGLELSADLHGWAGADAHDFQTAWAGTLGVNLVAKF